MVVVGNGDGGGNKVDGSGDDDGGCCTGDRATQRWSRLWIWHLRKSQQVRRLLQC